MKNIVRLILIASLMLLNSCNDSSTGPDGEDALGKNKFYKEIVVEFHNIEVFDSLYTSTTPKSTQTSTISQSFIFDLDSSDNFNNQDILTASGKMTEGSYDDFFNYGLKLVSDKKNNKITELNIDANTITNSSSGMGGKKVKKSLSAHLIWKLKDVKYQYDKDTCINIVLPANNIVKANLTFNYTWNLKEEHSDESQFDYYKYSRFNNLTDSSKIVIRIR